MPQDFRDSNEGCCENHAEYHLVLYRKALVSGSVVKQRSSYGANGTLASHLPPIGLAEAKGVCFAKHGLLVQNKARSQEIVTPCSKSKLFVERGSLACICIKPFPLPEPSFLEPSSLKFRSSLPYMFLIKIISLHVSYVTHHRSSLRTFPKSYSLYVQVWLRQHQESRPRGFWQPQSLWYRPLLFSLWLASWPTVEMAADFP